MDNTNIKESSDLEKIMFLMKRMKKNTPSIFQRLFLNLFSFFTFFFYINKDDNDNINILRQKPLTPDIILKYIDEESNYEENLDVLKTNVILSRTKSISDSEFKEHCLQAIKLCKKIIFKFKIISVFAKLSNFCILGVLPVFSQYSVKIEISIIVSLFGSLIFTLDAVGDWSKLMEKYSHIHNEFYELINCDSQNRIKIFEELALKYESNFLFIDFINQNDYITKDIL